MAVCCSWVIVVCGRKKSYKFFDSCITGIQKRCKNAMRYDYETGQPKPLAPKVPAALYYSRSARLFCAFFRVPVEQLLKDLQLFFLPDTTTTPLQYTAILDHQMSFFFSFLQPSVVFNCLWSISKL